LLDIFGLFYKLNFHLTCKIFQAAFSRRTTVRQIEEFLSTRLHVNKEDMRLWFFRDETNMRLLENDCITLEDAGFRDEDSLLVIYLIVLGVVLKGSSINDSQFLYNF
jgi:hypothetical protein